MEAESRKQTDVNESNFTQPQRSERNNKTLPLGNMLIIRYRLALMSIIAVSSSRRGQAFTAISPTIHRVWVSPSSSSHLRFGNEGAIPKWLKRAFRTHHKGSTNKFDLYRHQLQSNSRNTDVPYIEGNGIQASRQAIKVLAQKNRTWLRLKDIVELCSKTSLKDQKTVADVGCDHGLLSIALASSGYYENVIGVDVSHRALEGGALKFHKKVKDIIDRTAEDSSGIEGDRLSGPLLPLQFREGDGLLPLKPGEADAVCIAGMGVETMISILNSRVPNSYPHQKCIDYIKCNSLYLQPQKSRPRYLVKLYRNLQNEGWTLSDERISYLKSRWYLTSAFKRDDTKAERCNLLPGSFLLKNKSSAVMEEYDHYVNHHLKWLEDDLMKGSLSEDDKLWKDWSKS